MLDIKRIRDDPAAVRAALASRGGPWADEFDNLLGLDRRWREVTQDVNRMRKERNDASQEIGKMKDPAARDSKVEQVRALKDRLTALETELRDLADRRERLLLELPNTPDPSVPQGTDDTHNVEVRAWGAPRTFTFPALDHAAVGEALGIIDFARGVKLAGEGFYALVGWGARLERALIQFFLDEAWARGYREVMPPFIVTEETATGTGHLPKNADDMYLIERDKMALVPTAEVPLTSFHRGDLILASQLPIRLCAYTPCWRREAGRTTDTRGLIRVHQFNKVELLKITTPDQAWAELDALTADAESLLRKLGLPYRVIELCTGDLGFSAAKTFDIEVWLPSQGAFREISSCSCFTDFQARRAGLKFREKEGQVGSLPFTLNGSGLAVGRTLVAVLENYQREDGSVEIPQALRPYVGGASEVARP